MSALTSIEKLKFEKLLNMQQGYVSNFSNRTFRNFIQDTIAVDIYSDDYSGGGDSKANRLRTLWSIGTNAQVLQVMSEMIEYVRSADSFNWNEDLANVCMRVLERLTGAHNLDVGAFTANRASDGFEMCAKEVRDYIQGNKLREGLDRLHNFLTDYIRSLCLQLNIEVKPEKSLNALFAEYVRCLVESGRLQSSMSEQILKMSISALERFNTVRNDQSLAHPNEVLNYNESLLIFNYVAATVRFLESLQS